VYEGYPEPPVHVIWIEFDGFFEFGDGGVVLMFPHEDKSEPGVGLWQVAIDLDCLACKVVCLVKNCGIEKVAVDRIDPDDNVAIRENDVGAGAIRVYF
jgi:hypothetical protein